MTITNRIIIRNNIRKIGLVVYTPKPKAYKRVLRTTLGIGLICLGLGTWYVPFTTIPLCSIGGGLLGFDVVGYYKSIRSRIAYESHRSYLVLKWRYRACTP